MKLDLRAWKERDLFDAVPAEANNGYSNKSQ